VVIKRALLAPIAHLWIVNSASSWRSLPRPVESPFAAASGVDPHRLLLIGSGMAVGYGVLSHDLALAGHLARDISARTGRGVDIDVRAASELTVPAAAAQLSTLDLARYDGIVLTLGGLEILGLMPPAVWRQQLDALLDAVAARGASAPIVYVVGTGRMPDYLRMPGLIARAVSRHGPLIEAESVAACNGRDRAVFVPFEPRAGDAVRYANRETYEEWAALIAPIIARDLSLPATETELTVDDDARVAEVDRLRILHSPSDPAPDRLVATARHLFGVEAAAVTVVHRDTVRLWSSDGFGPAQIDVPREHTLCDLTIRRAGHTVVEDLAATAGAWSTTPKSEWVRFYAGYPIESPQGFRVGTFMIASASARSFTAADGALLRDFALRVQALLRDRTAV
jgi:hypothetical protein